MNPLLVNTSMKVFIISIYLVTLLTCMYTLGRAYVYGAVRIDVLNG